MRALVTYARFACVHNRYVPVDVIVSFAKVKALTDSTELLVESIKDSKVQSLVSLGIHGRQHAL